MIEQRLKIGILCIDAFSGGNIVILEHLSRISLRCGYEVYLIIRGKEDLENIFPWYKEKNNFKVLNYQEAQKINFDALIASFWETCYDLYLFSSKAYLYFTQSIESKFYDKHDINKINSANASYFFDLTLVTEASWIKHYLKDNYNLESELVLNGINKNNFSIVGKTIESRKPNNLRILIEGPLYSESKNVARTIEICKQSEADEIWLLTSTEVENVVGVDKVFSKIPLEQVGEIYRSCDVLVKLSKVEGMFGPPLEMFHCGGTAISYAVTGHDEYMVHEYNSLIAPMDDETKILEYINLLKNKPEILNLLKVNALATANNWHDWEEASFNFESVLKKCLTKPQTTQNALKNKTETFKSWINDNNEKTSLIIKIQKKLGYRFQRYFETKFLKKQQ